MNTWYYLSVIFVMALVTYVPRALPLGVLRRPIRNRFVCSFLEYMPIAVLSAMTVPAVFTATASEWSAIAAVAVALVFSYLDFSLLPVALLSTATVFIVELLRFGWIA